MGYFTKRQENKNGIVASSKGWLGKTSIHDTFSYKTSANKKNNNFYVAADTVHFLNALENSSILLIQ
jgi:hypothetical protein